MGETRREVRFYVCLLLGFILMVWGFYVDPPGHISNSVLFGAGLLLSIGAVGVGIDIPAILDKLIELRKVSLTMPEKK